MFQYSYHNHYIDKLSYSLGYIVKYTTFFIDKKLYTYITIKFFLINFHLVGHQETKLFDFPNLSFHLDGMINLYIYFMNIITGSNGLLGSAVKKAISTMGNKSINHTRTDCDLLDSGATSDYFNEVFEEKNPDTLIHCAAKVGGVGANMEHNVIFFKDNLQINKNILTNSYKHNIKNFVSVLSTCVFPDDIEYPLTSDKIDDGRPHISNHGYAYSKRLLRYETDIYRNMNGGNWISIIPTNLYGPNDNFNLEDSHLIPALIRKAHECSNDGSDFMVWGDGTPLRQFVYSEDLGDIILWAIENWTSDKPLMCVNEKEYSIEEVVMIIAKRFNIPPNRIKFDMGKPNGQYRKTANSDVPNWDFTSLEDGINLTIDWYLGNLDEIRK